MKLIYRGASYEYNPEFSRSGNTGRPVKNTHFSQPYKLIYRGVTTLVNPDAVAALDSLPMTYDLIYRGATYHVARNAELAPVQVQAPSAQAVRIPSTLPRHYIDKMHQANLAKNLQRRLDVAKQQGNQDLVALLEVERKQIAV